MLLILEDKITEPEAGAGKAQCIIVTPLGANPFGAFNSNNPPSQEEQIARDVKISDLIACINEKFSSTYELKLDWEAKEELSKFLLKLDRFPNKMGSSFTESLYHDICILISNAIERLIADAMGSEFQLDQHVKSAVHHCLHYVVKALIENPSEVDLEALSKEVKKLLFDDSLNTTYLTYVTYLMYVEDTLSELKKYESIADDLFEHRQDVFELLKTGIATLDDLLTLEPSWQSKFFPRISQFIDFLNKANTPACVDFMALNSEVRNELFLDLCRITHMDEHYHIMFMLGEDICIVEEIKERLQTLQPSNKEEPEAVVTQKSASFNTIPPHGANPFGAFNTSNPPSQEEESESEDDLTTAWDWLGFNH